MLNEPFNYGKISAKVRLREIYQCLYSKVETLLQTLNHTEFGVTDSVHRCVIAILFNRPFIAIGSTARGLTRLKFLLSLSVLRDRLVLKQDELFFSFIKSEMDWVQVNYIRLDYAEADMPFLRKHLRRWATGV